MTTVERSRVSGGNGHSLNSQASLNAYVKTICDIMRRSNCAGALQYVPELTWILFLRILDERETNEAEEASALNISFTPSLEPPFRWRDWAAPDSPRRQDDKFRALEFCPDGIASKAQRPQGSAQRNAAPDRDQ